MSDLSDKLVQQACDRATIAAGRILRENQTMLRAGEPAEIDYELLSDFLRAEVKANLPQALDDAKEALACNMGQIASATLHASMQLCGIRAASKYLDHVEPLYKDN